MDEQGDASHAYLKGSRGGFAEAAAQSALCQLKLIATDNATVKAASIVLFSAGGSKLERAVFLVSEVRFRHESRREPSKADERRTLAFRLSDLAQVTA
jgi:hypothetical protein